MKMLNNIQLLYIKNDLKSRKTASGFREELYDHVCCMVETELNNGLNFSKAYAKTLTEFSEQGFLELQKQSPVVKKKRLLITSQLAGATVAASIFMMVFGVGAQSPPERNPLDNYKKITSGFGLRMDPISKTKKKHIGMDFSSYLGSPVMATADGIVVFLDYSEEKYGNQIIIKHDDQFETRYAHLQKINVEEGQKIKLGDVIGSVGNSGASTAPHLHYEVIKDGEEVDPAKYLAIQE